MIIVLLIIIAIGVLLISEQGRNILNAFSGFLVISIFIICIIGVILIFASFRNKEALKARKQDARNFDISNNLLNSQTYYKPIGPYVDISATLGEGDNLRNPYLWQGEKIYIIEKKGNYFFVNFTTTSGILLEGWVKVEDLRVY